MRCGPGAVVSVLFCFGVRSTSNTYYSVYTYVIYTHVVGVLSLQAFGFFRTGGGGRCLAI